MKTDRSDPRYKSGYSAGYTAGRKRTEGVERDWEAIYAWNAEAKTALEAVAVIAARIEKAIPEYHHEMNLVRRALDKPTG